MEIIDRNSELGKQLEHLDKLAKEIRAPFLEQAIGIEGLIEDIISRHFCPDEERYNLFFSLIVSGAELTFSSKIQILKRILELHYQDLLTKYPRLIKELDKVRKFRNRIAHAMLDNSPEFLAHNHTDRIQLDYYQGGRKKKLVVTIADRDEKLKDCSRTVLTLVDIQKEVTKRTLANTA